MNILEGIFGNGTREGSHEYGTSAGEYQRMINDINEAAERGDMSRFNIGKTSDQIEQGACGFAHLSDKAKALLG